MTVMATICAAAALLLVWSGAEHLRHPAALGRVLAGSGGRLAAPAARTVAVAELLAGVATIGSLLAGIPGQGWALTAQGLLYAGFTASLWTRYRRGDRTDCGCTAVASVVGPAGVARAAGLAVASLATAAAGTVPTAPAAGTAWLVLLATGAGVMAVLLHALPAAIDGLPAGDPGTPA
ncbi:MAG: hypothetical protein GEV09_17185 [Pseudonocardiaceae bacterium]|nr:hypothetical protein [Pseudonocardiaceae bacterium]